MTQSNSTAHTSLPGVEAALQRAAQRARTLARQTDTPLVIFKDGRIERQSPSIPTDAALASGTQR